MKYLMLVCTDSSVEVGPADAGSMARETQAWVTEMDGRGVRLNGDRVRPAADATTVRVRNDELLVSDGPFAETKEQMAGYDVLECTDLDEAIEVAAKHPMARFGMLEIRPFWQE
jgi:hypothetical protein